MEDAETQRKTEELESWRGYRPPALRKRRERRTQSKLLFLSVFSASPRLRGKLRAGYRKITARVLHAIMASSMTVLDINDIREILPHRYPFLLVDRIRSEERRVGKEGR